MSIIAIPSILSSSQTISGVGATKTGFGSTVSVKFILDIKQEYKLHNTTDLVSSVPNELEGNKFNGKTFVISGFRDEEFENYITQNGGKIGNNITKKTVALIVKEKGLKETGKTKDANKKEIPILTREEFYEEY